MRYRLTPLILVALLAAACGPATPSATPSPTIPNPVMGKTWNLASITEQTPAFQGVVPPATQVDYTANFNPDGSFLARGDCNQVFGTWTYTPPTSLTIAFSAPPLIQFCGPDSFSGIYLQALAQTQGVGVTDTGMVLNLAAGASLQFVPAPPDQTPPPSVAPVTPVPTPSLTATPSPSPTSTPSASATTAPTASATAAPTASATAAPTASATAAPTASATAAPTPSATAAPSVTPTTPPPSSSAAPGTGLLANPWQPTVITFTEPAGKVDFPAEQRPNYLLTFMSDGTFTAVVDCNRLSGSYTSTDPMQATGDLTLVPGPFTAAACPPGSYSDLYVYALGRAQSYAIDATTKLLTITMIDGGMAVFEVGTATP